jgi:catalase
MNVLGNQGSRPNYPSTVHTLGLASRVADGSNHTQWTGTALRYLSHIQDIDFEWPAIFVSRINTT